MIPSVLRARRRLAGDAILATLVLGLAGAVPAAPAGAGPAVLPVNTLFTLPGLGADTYFGAALANAGDVNGDGYDDLIVGAYRASIGFASAGAAYIYFGGPTVHTAPDLTLLGRQAFEYFGFSVAGAGDVNGDGYDDVIVGAYGADWSGTDAGRAYVFFGGPAMDAVPDLILEGGAAFDKFGGAVAPAGDMNGDGYADVIVGAQNADIGATNAGRAYVYFGGAAPDSVADVRYTGTVAQQRLGYSVAPAGDVNGDGYDDVLVGSPLLGNGVIGLYLGGPAPVDSPQLISSPAGVPLFGRALAPAGDFDHDGHPDVLVSDRDVTYLYFGGAALHATPDLILHHGITAAAAGDVNADGIADVVTGAPADPSSAAGAAYGYFGGAPPDSTADILMTGASPGESFGSAVCAVRDFGAIGSVQFLVGAYLNDDAGHDAGKVYVIGLGSQSVLEPNGGELWVEGTTDSIRWFGEGPADLALSVDAGRSWIPIASGVGLAGFNQMPLTVPGLPTDSALVRASAAGEPITAANSDRSDGFFRIRPFRLRSPVGGELWYASSPQSIRWRGPALADLALSNDDGATWTPLATGVGGAEENGWDLVVPDLPGTRARVRVSVSGEVPDAAHAEVSPLPFTLLDYRVLSPNGGERWVALTPDSVRWAGALPADVALSSDAGRSWLTLATGAGGDSINTLDVGVPGAFGDSARVRVSVSGAPVTATHSDQSDGYFEVAAFDLLTPNGGETWPAGTTQEVRWRGGLPADVWLSLDAGASWTLQASSVGGSGDNRFPFTVPAVVSAAAKMRVSVNGVAPTPVSSDRSDTPFSIVLYQVLAPTPGTVWSAGDTESVHWTGRVPADVAFSADSGLTWTPLGTGVGGSDDNVYSFVVPTLATHAGRVRVSVSGQPPTASNSVLNDGWIQVTTFQLLSPAAGEVWPAGARREVHWTGRAPADLAFSADSGRTWAPLAYHVGGADDNRYAFSVPVLGAKRVKLRVSGSDQPVTPASSVVSSADFRAYTYDVQAPGAGGVWVVGSGLDVRWLGPLRADLALTADGGVTWTAIASAIGGDSLNTYTIPSPPILGPLGRVRLNVTGLPPSDSASAFSIGTFRIGVYELTSPRGGETWLSGTQQTIRWRGRTPADLALSVDGRATWTPLASGVGGLDVNAATITVPSATAGGFAYVRVSPNGQAASAENSDTNPDPVRIISADGSFGPSLRTLMAPIGDSIFGYMGSAVASAGDMNGDGFGDVIVGAYGTDSRGHLTGHAYVYFGGPRPDSNPDLDLTGGSTYQAFGYSIAGIGDVNGDGYDDIAVGGDGRVSIFFGGPLPDATADMVLTGTSGETFGASIAGGGDFNGDGYPDFVVGTQGSIPYGGGPSYVFLGGPVLSKTPFATLPSLGTPSSSGFRVAFAGDVDHDGYDDVLVGAPAVATGEPGSATLYAGSPYPGVTRQWTYTGAIAGEQFGYSIGGVRDMNGDGFPDVVIGAPAAGPGHAYVYFGGVSPHTTPDLTLTGRANGDQFGFAVGSAGDLNGDGFDDVVVGAERNDAAGLDAGQALIFAGGFAPDAIPDIAISGQVPGDNFGSAVAAAGDVNGDGLGDFVVGARLADPGGVNTGRAYVLTLFHHVLLYPVGGETWITGSPVTIAWEGAPLADLALSVDDGATWSVIATGVGGDSLNSFAFTVPDLPTTTARLRVSANGFTVTRANAATSDRFRIAHPTPLRPALWSLDSALAGPRAGGLAGFALAAAADFDGDGRPDLMAGAPLDDRNGSEAGAVILHYASPASTAPRVLLGEAPGDRFGSAIAIAGDVNHDGYPDLIVGAPGSDASASGGGRAYLYFGGPTAHDRPDVTLSGAAAGDRFGAAVAGAGDVNHDGFDDVIVGAPGNDAAGAAAGRAYVYFGGPTLHTEPDLTLTGAAAGDEFGRAVAGAGDVNGDGAADFLVGAPFSDSHGLDAGRVYLFYGGSQPSPKPALKFDGASPYDNFGTALAGGGDMNGDGFADFAAAAPFSDLGGIDVGRASVFYGGAKPHAYAAFGIRGSARSGQFGSSLAFVGDLNGDGFDDLAVGAPFEAGNGVDAGAVRIFGGALLPDSVEDLVIPGPAPGARFGAAVAAAGDFFADGLPDVLVSTPWAAGTAGADAGAVWTLDWKRYHLLRPVPGDIWQAGANARVRWAGREPARVWLSLDDGASWERIADSATGADTSEVTVRVPGRASTAARVRIAPADPAVSGRAETAGTFSIRAEVTLWTFTLERSESGARLVWSTDPRVGEAGISGYRLFRADPGEAGQGVRIGPELLTDTTFTDPAARPGQRYTLVAVNGVGDELTLGETAVPAPLAGLRAWPAPARGGRVHLELPAPLDAAGRSAPDLDVSIYDVRGRRVMTLVHGAARVVLGVIALDWDGRTNAGGTAPAGIYFVRALAPSAGLRLERKLAVVR